MTPVCDAMYSAVVRIGTAEVVRHAYYIVERIHHTSPHLEGGLFDDTPPVPVDIRWMYTREQAVLTGIEVSSIPERAHHVLDSDHYQLRFMWEQSHIRMEYRVYPDTKTPATITIAGRVNTSRKMTSLYWSPGEERARRVLARTIATTNLGDYLRVNHRPRANKITPELGTCYGCGIRGLLETSILCNGERYLFDGQCWGRADFARRVFDELRRRRGSTAKLAALVSEYACLYTR